MKEPKDKRTKEYKQWKQTYGLGDLVEDALKVTGVKKIVDDCKPCEERKRLLNKIPLFRKHKVARCLTDEQIQQYKEYKDNHVKDTWKPEDVKLLIDLYAHAFAIQYHTRNFCTNCSGSGKTLQNIENQLDKITV